MGPKQMNEAAYAALEDAEQVDEAAVEALIIAWAHSVHQTTVLASAQTYAVGLVHGGGVSTTGGEQRLQWMATVHIQTVYMPPQGQCH